MRPAAPDTEDARTFRRWRKMPSTGSDSPLDDRSNRSADHANPPSAICPWCARICSQIGLVHESPSSRTRRSGCETGRFLSRRLFRIEKSAALAPIPRASDRTASTVTRGVAHSERHASRQSVLSSVDNFGSSRPTGAGRPTRRSATPYQGVSTTVTAHNASCARKTTLARGLAILLERVTHPGAEALPGFRADTPSGASRTTASRVPLLRERADLVDRVHQ